MYVGQLSLAGEYGRSITQLILVFSVPQARRIESDLQDKLVQGDFCGGHRPGEADSSLSFFGKGILKKFSRQLVELVQSESSIDSLRSALEVRTNHLSFC
jgi:hypothetical protein